MDELYALEQYSAQTNVLNFDFDKVIIGKYDKILTYENQLKAWKNHKNLQIINGGHFLFYKFNDFDDIIEEY